MTLLAVIQASALALLHRPLTALMRTRPAQVAVFLVGSRLMTVYLWHLPMIMVLTGMQLLLPLPMPAPGSTVWWWTRPVFLFVVLSAVWLLSLWLVRFEAPRTVGALRFPSPAATAVAVIAFCVPVVAITAYGLDFPLAAIALACTSAALWLTGGARRRVA